MTGTRPSLGFGNLFFSVNRHGTVSTSSPLWASAIRARQQNGLKRRSASAPARSYIVTAIADPPHSAATIALFAGSRQARAGAPDSRLAQRLLQCSRPVTAV